MTAAYLPNIAPPDAIEQLSFETVLAQSKALLIALDTEQGVYQAALQLETDPITKLLEVLAEREINLRARINDAVKATMLAFAQGEDLKHKALDDGLEMLEGESEEAFRLRIWLSKSRHTTAGAIDTYLFFARGASAEVKDVSYHSPQPLDVEITVLSATGNGTASAELISTVAAAVNEDSVRPQGDVVVVQTASIIEYQISAQLEIAADQPDAELVRSTAEQAVINYATDQHRLAAKITHAGLYAALKVEGVEDVTLQSPSPIACTRSQAPWCTDFTITMAEAL